MSFTPTTKRSAEVEHPDGSHYWTETVDDLEVIRTRTVIGEPWQEQRYNCFCCSCEESETWTYTDAACRLHGFAGKRPCDIHDLPGQVWGEELAGTPQFGKMPDAVTIERASHKR